ncbi:MAG: shikimate dehydrogenase [Sporolactobacillus sp.]
MKIWYGLIGSPVSRSLSPLMHRFWFARGRIEADYQAKEVRAEELRLTIEKLRDDATVGGFNVTAPHKHAILPLLDHLDLAAERLGAVNTVVCREGRLIGYNTDGAGFIKSLENQNGGHLSKRQDVLILGAGGAAHAVALTLAAYGLRRIDIANRTLNKASRLSRECGRFCNSKELSLKQAGDELENYSLIINATSAGLSAATDGLLIDPAGAHKGAFFVDLIYRPTRTAFLKRAETLDYRVMNGLPMLILQGAYAFQKWTGIFPDIHAAERYLQKKE